MELWTEQFPLEDALNRAFSTYTEEGAGSGLGDELPWLGEYGYGQFLAAFGLLPARGVPMLRACLALLTIWLLNVMVRARKWANNQARASDDDLEQARAAFDADPAGVAWQVWQFLFMLALTAATVGAFLKGPH